MWIPWNTRQNKSFWSCKIVQFTSYNSSVIIHFRKELISSSFTHLCVCMCVSHAHGGRSPWKQITMVTSHHDARSPGAVLHNQVLRKTYFMHKLVTFHWAYNNHYKQLCGPTLQEIMNSISLVLTCTSVTEFCDLVYYKNRCCSIHHAMIFVIVMGLWLPVQT